MLQPWEESWTFPVYYKYMYVYIIPSPCATANMCHESTGGQTARVGSVKGRSDFALCCAVSSIVLSVRALSPPSPFSPSFFSYFPLSPLGRAQVDGRFPLLLSDAPGFAHQKKSSQTPTKPPCPPSSFKLLQQLVRNY